MTVKDLAEAVARQSLLVETLGMTNCAKPPAERVAQLAEYELATATLRALREQLLSAISATQTCSQQAMNDMCGPVETLYRVH